MDEDNYGGQLIADRITRTASLIRAVFIKKGSTGDSWLGAINGEQKVRAAG
jgi:hypothetical protein